MILFQASLFLKEFLACNGCFELFAKIKKESETSFWCTLSAWCFHKNYPYLILYLWTKFQCHIFFFLFVSPPQFLILLAFISGQWSLGFVTFSWFFHRFNKKYLFTCYKSSCSDNLLKQSCLLISVSHTYFTGIHRLAC